MSIEKKIDLLVFDFDHQQKPLNCNVRDFTIFAFLICYDRVVVTSLKENGKTVPTTVSSSNSLKFKSDRSSDLRQKQKTNKRIHR